MYPRNFDDLIQALHKLPGVGMKTAERYAFAILNWPEEERNDFLQSLSRVRKIQHCKVCGNISDGPICPICQDESRDEDIICVVQSPKDIAAIESMDEFNGVYHVLNGLINTAKGILPEQLNIDQLTDRITDSTEEVILALDPTIEGETTMMYLERLLKDSVEVSRLAQGIPMGSRLDYADARTLSRAFAGRTKADKDNSANS